MFPHWLNVAGTLERNLFTTSAASSWRGRCVFPAIAIELGHAVALRVAHPVAEYAGTAVSRVRILQQTGQAITIKNVVAKNQAAWFAADKLASDDEGLCEPIRRRLHA